MRKKDKNALEMTMNKHELLRLADLFECAVEGASTNSLAKDGQCAPTTMGHRLGFMCHILLPMISTKAPEEFFGELPMWKTNKNEWISALNRFREILKDQNSSITVWQLRCNGSLPPSIFEMNTN